MAFVKITGTSGQPYIACFALRLIDETNFQKAEKEIEKIKSYRKEAIKNLPFKERIIKIISDIYTGV
ncbi:MAG TPA: hypothetical protein EYP82_02040 [Hydrogenothermaceae bacterium]|nr:hypothetical protein [Hydrogenothermaceae bacterium]